MKKIIFLGCVLLITCTSLSKAQNFDTSKLDSLFSLIETYEKGMGCISIFQEGKEIYQRAYGYSDVETEIKNSTNTKFRIGSVSKTFTATIVMKLVEEGKLSLVSKLSDYYPQIPNSGNITIEHLLWHRSGICNFTDMDGYTEWNTQKQTKEELLNRIISGGVSFNPDEKFAYSNSNYVLLTCIVEDITGKNFSDLLNEIVIVPCNLNNTYVGGNINRNNREAYSYSKHSSNWKKTSETDMSIPLGAGFIVSTPYDLNIFLHCLFSGKVVNKESLSKILTLKDNFGFGLFQVSFYDNIGYGHTGGIDGFQSNAFYFPESKLSIALIENGVVYMLSNIIKGCLSVCFGKNYDLPVFIDTIELTGKELDKYLGIFSSPELPIKLTITKKGNTLIVQGTGQSELPLEYIGSNIFRSEGVDLVLEFIPEENKLVLKQLGMTFEMSKELLDE